MFKEMVFVIIRYLTVFWLIGLISLYLILRLGNNPNVSTSSAERCKMNYTLNLPFFYFSINTFYYEPVPDLGIPPEEKEWLEKLNFGINNMDDVFRFYDLLKKELNGRNMTLKYPLNLLKNSNFSHLAFDLAKHALPEEIYESLDAFKLKYEEKNWTAYLPGIYWNGAHCSYHRWLFGYGQEKGIVHGNFGKSKTDGSDLFSVVKKALGNSIALYGGALILGLFLALLLKSLDCYERWKWVNSHLLKFSFLIAAVPTFLIAFFVLFLFSNIAVFYWFPSSGMAEEMGFSVGFFVLPFFVFSVGFTAFSYLYIDGFIKSALSLPFAIAAKGKGCSEKEVFWRHVVPYCYPAIFGLMVRFLPVMFGGSLIIESIFQFDGMGLLMFKAIKSMDVDLMIFCAICSIFSCIGAFLINDLLMYYYPPSRRFSLMDKPQVSNSATFEKKAL